MSITHALFICSVILSLVIATLSQAADKRSKVLPKLEGFGEFKWGVTLSEVNSRTHLRCFKEDEKGIKECFASPIRTDNGDEKAVETVVGNVKTKVGYIFINSKLVEVDITIKDYKDRDIMFNNIVNKYGKPSKHSRDSEENKDVNITEWRVYDAKITTEDMGTAVGYFSVSLYAPTTDSLGF